MIVNTKGFTDDAWKVYFPCIWLLHSPSQEGKKRSKEVKHYHNHVHHQGGPGALGVTWPRCSQSSRRLCVPQDSSLQTTESFLTGVGRKGSNQRILGCSRTLFKGQRFMFFSSLLVSLLPFPLQVASTGWYQFFKKSVFELLTFILILIVFVILEHCCMQNPRVKGFQVFRPANVMLYLFAYLSLIF